jgi:hypothetical protein
MKRKPVNAAKRLAITTNARWYVCSLLLVFGCAAMPVRSSAQSCRSADDNSAHMIADLKAMVSSTSDSEGYQRRDLKIPVVDSSTIVLVTQTQVCNKALTAFLTTLPADFPTPLPTSVYVAKVGAVYVVMYPTPETRSPYAVLDSKYKVLSTYAY